MVSREWDSYPIFDWRLVLRAVGLVLSSALPLIAQETVPSSDNSSLDRGVSQPTVVVVCASTDGQHTHCPANTANGVTLLKSTGAGACVLGSTWGWDQTSIWVSKGCGGEFGAGQEPLAATQRQAPNQVATASEPEWPTWGVIDATGSGFVLHRSDRAELAIGAYAPIRYINQLPAEQQFTDHLGNVHDIDTRNDIQFHRAMIHFRGWLFLPKARYQITVWTVMSTDQTTLYGFLGYQFHKRFNVYGGINTLGGSRSVMGSHPSGWPTIA
jgi:hypothetical protein